jgi:hypothetical protein
MVEALSEADRELLDSAFNRAKERQTMAQRTIDETGRDVPQQRGRQVVEVLYLRPDPVMSWVAEWLPFPCVLPDGWFRTGLTRMRIILDNET